MTLFPRVLVALSLLMFASPAQAQAPLSISGIYPHLAVFNDENECGIGAVVPWADRLWVITYAPHAPSGSSDKLYEITPELKQIIRPESVGGTPANRMIHRESRQLFLGPYVIGEDRGVRVIPPAKMFGRLTGNARHLTHPAEKILFATMEEAIYEVDVKSLAVTELWTDEQRPAGRHAKLPGYHGKGLFSGQGRLVYANNGEHGAEAQRRPDIPSGALAEWDGRQDAWTVVARNQFTEVTGPGGIYGNDHPASDPLWSIGWDHRSLVLKVLDHGKWHTYRLPKGSHSYDGAHGWNTEWPRIRDIGEHDLLMTMHGTFWRFPKTFSSANATGIKPRSNYLKVVGDFCRWQDYVVLGCDDTARSEFLNKRKLKAGIAPAGQSQSNLRFVRSQELDQMGPALGRGCVWLNDAVNAGVNSDPYLVGAYDSETLLIAHRGDGALSLSIEIDESGRGEWKPFAEAEVPPQRLVVRYLTDLVKTGWIRLRPRQDATGLTVALHSCNQDRRGDKGNDIVQGLAAVGDKDISGGLLHARGNNFRTLRFVARGKDGPRGGYDLDGELNLKPTGDATGIEWVEKNVAIPQGVISVDDASVLYVDEAGRRWRLPKGDPAFDSHGALGPERVCREVCTERDLLNLHGTFYELPAENAGGFAKIRPIATHNRRIVDFATYRGLLALTGVKDDAAPRDHPRLVRSADGKAALWLGCVDDLWRFGKPRGVGGPWKTTAAKAGIASDPYLMTGYDRKTLTLAHTSPEPLTIHWEVDFTGAGDFVRYRELTVPPGESLTIGIDEGLQFYWARLVAEKDATITATFRYE